MNIEGARLLCKCCGSFRHLIANCPHSYENSAKVNVVKEELAEQVALYTGYDAAARNRLGEEAVNCAVLDTACTSTVCGKRWFEIYLDSMPEDERRSLTFGEGERTFKFGGGERRKSICLCILPCTIAGKSVTISTDVVESNIPLLLSLKALKAAKVKVDMENDSAEILGSTVSLNFTSCGHYCIPLLQCDQVELACYTRIQEMEDSKRMEALAKLHRQFGHPTQGRLRSLLEDAGACTEAVIKNLDDIYKKCETCKLHAKTPARPIVSLPMASRFNGIVAMDLKLWKNKSYILHMIDMFTRLSVAIFVPSKQPRDIVNAIILNWISGGWGVMEGMLVDNGGEFKNDKIREMAGLLNVRIHTTGVESPWSNGLCERNHAVTDRMLKILMDENPSSSPEVLLAWANAAKNSLKMVKEVLLLYKVASVHATVHQR